jgi:hypothetical protein
MKRNSTLLVCILLSLLIADNSFSQTYTISSSATWASTVSGSSCTNCVFNIAAGQTLTISSGSGCNNCTFNGGTVVFTTNFTIQSSTFNNDSVSIVNNNLTLQSYTTTSPTNYFNNTKLTESNNSQVIVNSPITSTNSKFTLNNKSTFLNNGGVDSMYNSQMYLNDTTNYTSNAGPVVLKNNSSITAGNGKVSSTAFIYMAMSSSTPLYMDNSSSIKVANNNNYYKNWSNYNIIGSPTSVSTSSNTIHCNNSTQSGYPNSCSASNVYGCATINFGGAIGCTTLALAPVNLSATLSNANTVELTWISAADLNTDHFSVQRSNDGQDWQTIGDVRFNGYNSFNTDYSFTDLNPASGANDYRLQIVDKDGTINYSKIVPVTLQGGTNTVNIYPNPITTQTFQLKTSSSAGVIVNIYNLGGQLLWRTNLTGQNQYQVNMPAAVPHNQLIVIQVISPEKNQSFKVFNQ